MFPFTMQGPLFQLSPSARMYLRVGKLSPADVVVSFQRRDYVGQSRLGSARAYQCGHGSTFGALICEFDLFPFVSNPALLQDDVSAFEEFVDTLDFES